MMLRLMIRCDDGRRHQRRRYIRLNTHEPASQPASERVEDSCREKQESCAIAKMTARCALYMSALKVFGTP